TPAPTGRTRIATAARLCPAMVARHPMRWGLVPEAPAAARRPAAAQAVVAGASVAAEPVVILRVGSVGPPRRLSRIPTRDADVAHRVRFDLTLSHRARGLS